MPEGLELAVRDARPEQLGEHLIALTPAGHVVLRPAEPHEPLPEPAAARRIRTAFERGYPAGLLHLGAAEARTPLPPAFGFWRDFGRVFVAALCALPDLEERAGK